MTEGGSPRSHVVRSTRSRDADDGARILVVDDQPGLAELIQAVLERDGQVVDSVLGGQAALEHLGHQAYDLVVCDLQMPDVDGAAVGRAARAAPAPCALHDRLRG